MHLGITGTQSGCNERQAMLIQEWLEVNAPYYTHFHHGDCVGVDVQVAEWADELGFIIVCHAPIKDDLRGFYRADETREPKNYLARNRDIVNESDFMLVVPYQNTHQVRGGTWYTHDYAEKQKVDKEVFYPHRR